MCELLIPLKKMRHLHEILWILFISGHVISSLIFLNVEIFVPLNNYYNIIFLGSTYSNLRVIARQPRLRFGWI